MKPCCFALIVCAAFSAFAAGAPSSQPTSQPGLLGEEFVSDANGIALRPPVNCDKIVSNVPDQIAEFDDPQLQWTLKVSRRSLETPVPLTTITDPDGTKHEGLLEMSVKQLRDQPVSQLVNQDITHIGQHRETSVALLVVRYDKNLQRRLRQQAIIEASEKFYYFLDLETPARPNAAGGANAAGAADADPGEQQAADAFNAVIDSVRLLDTTPIRRDQADRLLRTRSLIFSWTPAFLKAHLIPVQYFRFLRNGKDVGYSYETEEFDDKAGAVGGVPVVRVSMRSETWPQPENDVQVQSRLTVATNLATENWENLADSIKLPTADKKQGTRMRFSEVGTSLKSSKIRPVVHPGGMGAAVPPGQQGRGNQVDWVTRESWVLTVVRRGVDQDNPDIKQDLPDFKKDLPAFYLPQALSHMVPRLLPFRQARTYLFGVYVPNGDNGGPAVMLRYIDVLSPAEVNFNGKTIVAVPVNDRLGVDGPVQTHYLDADDGSYIGTITKASGADGEVAEMVIPTDAATLKKIWPNCNLTPPDLIVDSNAPVKGK